MRGLKPQGRSRTRTSPTNTSDSSMMSALQFVRGQQSSWDAWKNEIAVNLVDMSRYLIKRGTVEDEFEGALHIGFFAGFRKAWLLKK